jgi:hypothetical protein
MNIHEYANELIAHSTIKNSRSVHKVSFDKNFTFLDQL